MVHYNSGELADLRDENAELREQVENLQTQIGESKIERLQECKDGFAYHHGDAYLSNVVAHVIFDTEKTGEEKINFATKYGLTIPNTDFTDISTIDSVYLNLNIAEGPEAYEIMCSIKFDSEVVSVNMAYSNVYSNS